MSVDDVRYEDVAVGDELPPFVRRTHQMNWNRIAFVNDEIFHLHMDDELAKKRGERGVIGMGHVRYFYYHNLLRDWIGTDGEIKEIECDYRGVNYKDDLLTTTGTVTGKRIIEGQCLVDVALASVNQDGAVLSSGTAVVAIRGGDAP